MMRFADRARLPDPNPIALVTMRQELADLRL